MNNNKPTKFVVREKDIIFAVYIMLAIVCITIFQNILSIIIKLTMYYVCYKFVICKIPSLLSIDIEWPTDIKTVIFTSFATPISYICPTEFIPAVNGNINKMVDFFAAFF